MKVRRSKPRTKRPLADDEAKRRHESRGLIASTPRMKSPEASASATIRDRQVWDLYVIGHTVPMIAARMSISQSMVRTSLDRAHQDYKRDFEQAVAEEFRKSTALSDRIKRTLAPRALGHVTEDPRTGERVEHPPDLVWMGKLQYQQRTDDLRNARYATQRVELSGPAAGPILTQTTVVTSATAAQAMRAQFGDRAALPFPGSEDDAPDPGAKH